MALFGDKRDGTPAREEKPVSAKAGQLNALLGKGSEFEGKLTFEGEVRIDGKFSGQIVTKDTLTVGEGAKVTADIRKSSSEKLPIQRFMNQPPR